MTSIENSIQELYSKTPPPLYLSNLGILLKAKGIEYDNLKETIKNLENYIVVCGLEKEKTAISTIEDQDKIKSLLNPTSDKINKETLDFLTQLPYSFLCAFASKKEKSVYIMLEKPYKFAFKKTQDSMREIKESYRIDAKIPRDIKEMKSSSTTQLSKNIKKWAKEEDITLPKYDKHTGKSCKDDKTTLLEDMIQAIPENKRSKIVLPLDIICYLMNKE